MVSTYSLSEDTCFVVLFLEIISAIIRAAILSALYFLSLLLTARNISRFLSLFMVNIAHACAAVTNTPSTIRL